MLWLDHYTQLLIQGNQRACYNLIHEYLSNETNSASESTRIKISILTYSNLPCSILVNCGPITK